MPEPARAVAGRPLLHVVPAAPGPRDALTALPVAPGRPQSWTLPSGRDALAWRPWTTAAVGTAAASLVALVTRPPAHAAALGGGVTLRVAMIFMFTAAAIHAQRDPRQARMGQLLGWTMLLAAGWLLNGSTARLPFTLGIFLTGLAPAAIAYVMLAQPGGRLPSRRDRGFLVAVAASILTPWVIALIATGQPLLRTPLVRCAPHCPPSLVSLHLAGQVPTLVKVIAAIGWLGAPLGTAVLLGLRVRRSRPLRRRCLTPVLAAAILQCTLLGGFIALRAAHASAGWDVGALYIAGAVLVPFAIFLGLVRERLFIGEVLRRLVAQLATGPEQDPQALIASALADPTLQVVYPRGDGRYVDAAGATVDLNQAPPGSTVSSVRRNGAPVAALLHADDLAEEEGFIEAIGAAALIRLEDRRLRAELRATNRELEQSRARLVESAHAERRRIERDLHDSVQQQLVGLRIKLDMVGEHLRDEPSDSERQLNALGRQLDDVLHTLRLIARGIYPTVLHERGLGEAIKSAARSAPIPVSVRSTLTERLPEELEVAVYFCCLEALQNIAKHAGRAAHAAIVIASAPGQLGFEVRDQGTGFDPAIVRGGAGLVNMRDRIEAVGGRLTITSAPGGGTVVRGILPVH